MSASDGVDTTQKRALRESSAVPSERANFARIASDFNTSDNESGEKCCDVKHEVMSGLEFENASQTHSDCKSNEKAKNQKKDFYDLEDARKRQFSDTYVPGDGLNSQPGEVVEEDDDDDDSTTISDINSDDDFDLDGESVSMSDSDADSTVSSGTSSYRSSADSLGRRGSYDFLAASVAATNDDNLSESGGGDVGDDNDEEDEEFFDAENGEAHNKLEHSSAVSMTVSHPNGLPDKQTLSVSEQNNSGLVDSSSYSNASIQSNNESSGNDSECSPQKLEEHSKNNSSINMSDEKKEKSFSIDVSARTEPSSESDNAHESGAMSPMLSLDVIEGFSLSQAWVDRVNRSLAENVQPRVTTTGEELARSAVVRRIMKRFSEKGDSKSARPSFIAEGLRKTSSDKRPDRNTGVRNKSQVSRQGLQPLYGIVYNSKPRTQSYKRACSVPAVPSHIVEQLSPSHSSDQSMEQESNDSDAPDKQSSSQQIKTTQEPSACISKGKSNRRPAQQTSSSRVSLQATLPTIIDTSPQGKRPRAEGDIESLIGASYLSDNHAAVSVSVNDRSLRKSPHPVAECPVAHVSSGSEDESHSGRSTPTPSQTDHEDVKQGYNGSGYGRRENSISEEDSGKADVMDYTNSSREATTDVDSSVASVTTQDKETDSEEEDKSDILSHGLIRKPAVRRKGYAWVSKSLPKNADSDYKKQRLLQQQQQQGSKGRKLQRVKEGSSLELAPSLLNIYDDIVASGTRDDNGNECLLDDVSANKSSSPPLHYHQNTCVGKTQSLPPRTDGKIPLRSGKLPSLSEPSDRPVSMMDTDPSAPKQNQDHNDQKKRPLSISSMSSASSSSLPRLRKKRANMMKSATNDSRDTGIPDEEAEEASGFSSSAGGSGGNADGSGLGSESRNSVDSGCVDGDRSGERFFDNMSITSSETGSTRDEVDSSLWSGKDVSLTSVDTTMSSKQQQSRSKLLGNSSHPTPHVLQQTPSPSPYRKYSQDKATNENLGSLPDSPLSPRLTRPRRISSPLSGSISIPKPEDPRLLGDKASYLASPSPTSPAPDSPSGYDVIGSPDNGRRTLSSTRQEARKRFFSNYEEHLNQNRTGYVQAPLAESESLTSSAHEDSPETRCEASGSEPSLLSSQKTAASAAATKKQSSSPSSSPSSPPATTSTPSSASEATQQQQNHIPPFSPSSEKRSSDKHFRDKRSSRYDPNSSGMTSQRSVFSRSSKKRDTHPGADPGSRGSPVYVSYVQRVVTEIIESERTYIASLEDIIHGYLEPLETILNTRDAKKDISCLFSNIREIYKFGCIFLADLERTGSDPVKVAQCFVRHNKGFVIYTDYCTNYPRAVEVLTKFMQDPDLSELCKERQLALGHGLPLGAFLLRPVQRILKYHLLLQNIVKNCEKEGQDASILEAAFQHMTQMAHHINEMKRKHEHAVRIQEIQSQLEDYVGEDLTRLGELVLESTFRVYGAKASRQVFLFEKGLLISKKKEGGMLSCKTFIMCSNLMLVEVIPNEPLSFHVIPFNNPRAQYTLQARNMEQKRRWCQEVKRLILESFKGRIPDNVKNLVMQLGREHDDDYVTKEALEAVRKNQHTAPEYLEKRRVRKKSGSRIPDFILLKPQRARKDWNKKADKSKVSPEMGRRAESKSPDSHRRIFPKQLAPNKRRSQSQCTSMPTTPTSEISYPEMYNQPHPSRPQAVSQPVTPSQNPISAIVSSGAALVSFTKGLGGDDVSKKDKSKSKVTNNNSREGHEEELEKVKRAQSFRKAMRSRPLTSQDLSDLVARCGGSIKFSTPNKVKEDVFTEDVPDRQDLSGYSLRSRSDAEDSSDEGGDEEEDSIDNKSALKSEETSFDRDMISVDSIADEDVDDTKPIHTSATFDSPGDVKKGALGVEDNDMMSPEARSASLPSLHNSERNSGFQADSSKRSRTNQLKSEKMSSYSSDNITSHRGSGRMSRRDMQNASLQNGRYGQRKGQGTAGSCDKVKDENSERKVTAFHDTYSKRTGDKAILRKKGLRLPNTSKHLPLPEPRASPHPNGIKAKLTDWNSGVDKLTKGSLSDISHLDEDPWVINSDSTSPGTSVSESLNSTAQDLSINDSSHAHGGARPRGHSDLSEMMKVSGNKENLDWLVYLNRNSYGSPSEAASASKQRLSTSALDWGCQRKENLDAKRRISAQVPYATPPRSYMTTENMKKFGSGKDKPQNVQSNGNKSTINVVPVSSVSAFGVPPMTITIARPTTLNASNLTRCNSIPASTCSRPETVTRVRPSSMDMEKLADESDRMVAEMEEYISRTSSSESMKGTSKFPTTLPTITVEEEEDDKELNRLSVVSSVSTSSYDSQASSSSDGLVGTLKTKLHTWAQRMGKREDSEISLTSTLTSDEEDKVDMFTGANTFEPPLHKENLWQADRQLESVLREHCQGGSVIGSRMAHTLPKGMESPTLHHHGDTVSSSSEARPHSTCGLSRVDTCQQVQDEQASPAKESAPDHARFSLPPTTEATEALMPPALKSCDIQQSDSGFSLQSNDSNLSETQTPAPEPLPQPLLELSEDSSKEVTPETKPKMDKSSKSKQSSPSAKSSVKRTDSCESIDSTDSFYERRLSVAFDSEVFNEEPVIVTVYEDRPQGHVEVQPRKHTIREYVQLIEQKLKPQSPKVFEVRRREPGTMIRQRLETLRESALYGRSSSSHGSSRQASEEREFIRSKSQPPSQYRTKLNSADRYDCRCSDDISVNGIRHFSSKESLSKSRERINLSKSRESVNSNLSRESLVTSKSREKINFGGSESSDSKPSSPALRIRSTNHGHESDSSRFLFMSPGPSEPSTANQFRYRARSNSDQPLSETERSPTPGAEGGMQPSKSMCKLDQLSSEVDNLVIMKGWVRALISRFQEPSES